MYDTFFDLQRRPFTALPVVDQYFPGEAIENARQTLLRCIERGEGAGMIVGPSGTGKTLLCQLLAEQLKESFQIALLQSGRIGSRRALLQAILYELGRPYRDMDEGEVRLALVDYLTDGEDSPEGMVLLVDEAHTLPLRLLDELRMLTNLARDGTPLLRLVLAGSGVLEERFASPKLDSFSQRLVARCYLESFNRMETEDYIRAQLNSAGGDGQTIFPNESCHAVYQATDGVPRLINQLCDHALVLAYVAQQSPLRPMHVEEAWADLQQLPTPWNGQPDDDVAANVIEFGGLDDSLEEADEPDGADEPVEQAATIPALRITPESELPELTEGGPAEKLEQIEGLLAEVGDDFRPAGTIHPELELAFDEADHPFGERFEEEEVVADRYAPAAEAAGEPAAEEFRHHDGPVAEPGPAETVPLASEPAASAEPTAEDMLIVEEGYDGVERPRPLMAVRRREFDRLFARLLHG